MPAPQEWKPRRKKALKDRWLDREVSVETWFERDRAFVGIQDVETGDYLAEWWDEDVEGLFEDGYFVRGRRFEESVIDYAIQVGVPAYKAIVRKRS